MEEVAPIVNEEGELKEFMKNNIMSRIFGFNCMDQENWSKSSSPCFRKIKGLKTKIRISY